MGKPSGLKQSCSVLCLLLVGALGVAFGAPARRPARNVRHHRVYRHRRYYRASYVDPSKDDVTTYDDPIVRQIAVEALGHQSGSVVAVNPENGRILAIVNQKMAFSSALEPCSTIKPFVTIAALKEDVITGDTMLRVAPRRYMNLTEALAHSNNEFFQQVGTQLGFNRVVKYETMLGLGQKVGYDIPEEQPGYLPSAPPQFGGVARMSSFGEGIRITPFQLASLVTMVANGGTQYYLQYPRSPEAIETFRPRIRDRFDLQSYLPDLRQGMLGAVLYGTARRSYDPDGEQDLGKTGTCTDDHVGGHLGWFVSYADQQHPKLVLVVLLHGSNPWISGPRASGIAGQIYRGLYAHNYFATVADTHPEDYSGATESSEASR
ncbi:MAG TPA: penicillin-binding transpeptidase domain-containing protein [Candidatus Dormibacteraeota bacterium]|nr:penicillin-binding transpeptidase domain-containing protein [Candidatus Dormibacteraeota bacterium]